MKDSFFQIDTIKQTHESLSGNWIAMFEYSKEH